MGARKNSFLSQPQFSFCETVARAPHHQDVFAFLLKFLELSSISSMNAYWKNYGIDKKGISFLGVTRTH